MHSLPSVRGQYRLNYNLAPLTWFKVGGPAAVFFKPYDTEDLIYFFKQIQLKLPITVIGAGSNIIIRDGGIEGAVIKLGQNFTKIELTKEKTIVVGAGCLNFNLAKFCQSNSIAGFEFLIGIPGTIGGGIAMNAGAYGREFKDLVISTEIIDSHSGEIYNLSADEIGFRHRGNNLPSNFIITKVVFDALEGDQKIINDLMSEITLKRAATQPVTMRTGGSTFVNPGDCKAWELIDKAGLRGYKLGNATISQLHCNFMINLGEATAHELEELGEYVRSRVYEKSGILMEWEIKRLGKNV